MSRYLTSQQLEVLLLLADGLLNKQIAERLNVSKAIVDARVVAILRKLGVSDRSQAVRVARRCGLIAGDGQFVPGRPPTPEDRSVCEAVLSSCCLRILDEHGVPGGDVNARLGDGGALVAERVSV